MTELPPEPSDPPRTKRTLHEVPGSPVYTVTCGLCGAWVDRITTTKVPAPASSSLSTDPPLTSWYMSPCGCWLPDTANPLPSNAYYIHIPESRIVHHQSQRPGSRNPTA